MQPSFDIRRFALFMLVAVVVIVGWQWARRWLGLQQPNPVPKADKVAQKQEDKKAPEAKGPDPKEAKPQPKPPPAPIPPPVKIVQGPHKEIQVGGEDFNIDAVLSTHGAGVQRLILTHFQAADRMGKPENGLLELLPERINKDDPSNVILHYARADNDHPEAVLGQIEWNVDKQQNQAGLNEHLVVFSTTVPGTDIRLTKTFTLNKGDYHLGLEVKVKRVPAQGSTTNKDPVKFRYQLSSGHGLPIEGQWYTSIYRNALIGGFSEHENFWRDFQDSRQISFKGGGDKVGQGPNLRLEYAGVAVQYFASVTVVDDEQKDRNFLDWARPTIEDQPNPQKGYLDDIAVRVVSKEMQLIPGDPPHVHKYLLYNGPAKIRLLGDTARGRESLRLVS